MTATTAAGAGFLLAVLWCDLMHDSQVRKYSEAELPSAVLASICGYYRRVTTEAYPMNLLVALVMLMIVAVLAAELFVGGAPRWASGLSLALAVWGIAGTRRRTVPNARRLGAAQDTPQMQSTLARSIFRDHLLSFARMFVILCLQLYAY